LVAAGGAAGDGGKRRADFRAALAAVFHQVDQKLAHTFVAGGVNDRATVTAAGHKARVGQYGQLGRQGIGCDLERPGDLAGRDACGPGLDEQPKDGEAAILGESGQSFDGGAGFNSSTVVEIMKESTGWRAQDA